jgi:N-sulfoglucosamine sulfohydrolase
MNLPNNRSGFFRRNIKAVALLFFLSILMASCKQKKPEVPEIGPLKTIINPEIKGKPNILWIVAEDLSAYLPSFGDSTIVTPNLSKMASEGVCYDNFFAPHPVCAPARAAIITGMYANSIGASHMRTGPWFGGRPNEKLLINYQKAMPANIKPYEAVPGPEVRMFTEYLRAAGYYCSNNSKEDYQFIKSPTAWDESGPKAHWRNRPEGKPFFSVFNIGVTHESQIWKKQKDSLWVDSRLDVPVPPYLPNTEIAKNDIRRMYSNIAEMDARVGEILTELEADGLLENTIVFWYTDHGGPLPRQKRLLYDSGLKVPMIIRFPEAQFAGQRDERLTSFIDLAPTLLSLANLPIPDYIQGSAFLGKNMRLEEPKFVFAAADRFDETTDRVRSVRDNRFKYIKYYETEKPMYLEVSYRNQMPIMQELLKLKRNNALSPEQQLWFRTTKPKEELFDLINDPHELHDLSQNPDFKVKLDELRSACDSWTSEINDTGLIPEEQLIANMHPNGQKGLTIDPTVRLVNNQIVVACDTQGASIGYKVFNTSESPDQEPWLVYTKPIDLINKENIQVIAHKIGFLPSEVITLTLK